MDQRVAAVSGVKTKISSLQVGPFVEWSCLRDQEQLDEKVATIALLKDVLQRHKTASRAVSQTMVWTTYYARQLEGPNKTP